MRIDAVGAKCGGHAKLLVVVGVPLPLQTKSRFVELVALHGVDHLHVAGSLGLAPGNNRLTAISLGRHLAHHGPVVFPCDGLQVHHAAITFLVLEMQEPVFAL